MELEGLIFDVTTGDAKFRIDRIETKIVALAGNRIDIRSWAHITWLYGKSGKTSQSVSTDLIVESINKGILTNPLRV
jgi:hypothetical protein